jgi:hypothetical protein
MEPIFLLSRFPVPLLRLEEFQMAENLFSDAPIANAWRESDPEKLVYVGDLSRVHS